MHCLGAAPIQIGWLIDRITGQSSTLEPTLGKQVRAPDPSSSSFASPNKRDLYQTEPCKEVITLDECWQCMATLEDRPLIPDLIRMCAGKIVLARASAAVNISSLLPVQHFVGSNSWRMTFNLPGSCQPHIVDKSEPFSFTALVMLCAAMPKQDTQFCIDL